MCIKCLICDRPFDVLNNAHLRSAHNVDRDAYVKLFPGAVLVSVEYMQNQSLAMDETV